jgi:hypothetical protein
MSCFAFRVQLFVHSPGLEKNLEGVAQTVEQQGAELREVSEAVADLFRDLDVVGVPRGGPMRPCMQALGPGTLLAHHFEDEVLLLPLSPAIIEPPAGPPLAASKMALALRGFIKVL